MITAAEAGVHRFAPDGTALPTLGSALTELVPPRLNEIRRLFGADVEGRYHEVLNRQPIADDLIETSAGLAIVVRRAAGGKLWWELWFPDASGGARRRIRLELEEKRTIGGHLRCAGRGRRLACLFGRMTELFNPDRASIVLFDLDRVNRRGRCGT
jgi:hypothetical protein